MNRVHKIIWSSVLNTWVVVSELVSLHKKSSAASAEKLTPLASNTVNNHSPSINMPKLSLLALSLCAALSLTGTPSTFAADITSGGGNGADSLFTFGGNGGLAGGGGGAGAGTGGAAGNGGNGATLTTNAQAGGNGFDSSIGGSAPTGVASGGGGGGGGGPGTGNGGAGAAGNVNANNTVNNGGIISGNAGGSSASAGGGGGGGGGGLVLTSNGVTLNNSGSILGGAGGGGTISTGGAGGGGGAGLVVVNGAGGTITNTGSIAGGKGGDELSRRNGGGGAGVFLLNGGTLNNQAGTITGGNTGAATYSTTPLKALGGAGILSNRGVIENSGSITGGSVTGDQGSANSGIVANGGTITNSATGTITGGATTNAGSTTTGGNGVELINDGGATLTNYGTISGGATASATDGGTGVKVSSNGNTVINAGAINGTGTQDAVTLSGNNNTLQLQANYSFTGNVVSTGTGNTLALGGQTDASLDASQISATGQFQGFSAYEKVDDSTWTLTGITELATDWDVQGGTLHLADAGALNGGSVDLTGGILSAGSGTFTGDVNMTLTDGTINIVSGETADFSGGITGNADLIKTGTGTLLLSSVKSYTGDTIIDDGELKAGEVDVLVNSSALTINQGGTFNLNDLAQTVHNLSGAGDVLLGTGTLTANNTADTELSGAITGTGGLTKTGANTLTLSGLGSSVGAVDVQQGTLELAENGLFTSTDFVTQNGATTFLSGVVAQLSTGTFTQEAGSTLKIIFGEDFSKPAISADEVTLAGTLIFKGFTDQAIPVSATQAEARDYHLIESATDIVGDFDAEDISLVPISLDYLLHNGHISDDRRSYNLGFHMAWTTEQKEYATGDFTLRAGTAFDVDIVLNDRIVPVGGFDSNWDGKSLLKDGPGRLILSKQNGYTGLTTVLDGILEFGIDNSIASSSDVIVHNGLVDLKGYAQQFNRLSGDGGTINIDGAALTAHNATTADNTLYAGALTGNGQLIKTGLGRLTLSGDTLWTGDTELREGELVLDGVNGGAQLTSNILGQQGTQLKLLNGASLTGWIDPTDVEIDSSSIWNMTANSLVNNLTNNGMISFVDSLSNDFNTLTVQGNYQANNGQLVLNTRLGDDSSLTDKLVIEGDTAGTTLVQVNNSVGSGDVTQNGIEVITVAGQSDGEFVQSGRIAAGPYEYTLARGATNAKNWYLTAYLDDIGGGDGIERPEDGAYGSNLAAANNMFASLSMLTTSLHSRSGETEYIDPLTGEKRVTSLWLRSEGSHTRSRNESGQLKTQANRYAVQLGGNVAMLTNSGSDLFQLGAMGGYGNSQHTTTSNITSYYAKGKVDGYNVGVYGTWYASGMDRLGLYVDSWAQYGWFDNTVSGQGLKTEEYKSKGVTASVESGYTFKVSENAGRNTKTFIQPKAQAIWMDIKTDDHTEDTGTLVSGTGQGNIQTRLGVKTFMTAAQFDASTPSFQPFVEMNWVYNSKEFGSVMNGITVKQAGTRNMAEMKIGVEGNINRQVNLWGNVAQQVGDSGYSSTSVLLGVKYNF